MLFDSIPIENYIFSLLHVEIGVGNKILESFYNWISKYIEPLSKEEIEMINNLIDLQIELTENKKLLKQINHLNITKIADLTTEKKLIEELLKDKGGTSRFLICGNLKLEYIEEINRIKNEIIKLKEIRKEKELIISSNKQCIEYDQDCIKVYRIKNGKKPDSLIILMEKNISILWN